MSKPLTTIAGAAAITVALALPAVAAAKAPVSCHVPDLKGMTLTAARHKLSVAHCGIGKIAGSHAGKVVTQTPRAGRKEKHGTKVALTLKLKLTTALSNVSYSTSVDPTFTQDPTNPLSVTYTYDAGALQDSNGIVTNLAQTGSLPGGILNFYNGGSLACSTNVGGATSSGTCSVDYSATGTYQVTTQYIPTGASAVTETDTETISPMSTSTILAASFGAPFNVTGPPPTYLQSTNWFDGLDANYTQGSASSFTLTLTDQTTGTTQVGSSVSASSGCAVEFVQVNGSSNIGINPGCGLPGVSFADTDVISVTATTAASGGFLGSTSGSTKIWAG